MFFVGSLLASLLKCILGVQGNNLKRNKFWKKYMFFLIEVSEKTKILNLFVPWPEKLSDSRQKHFVRFVKKAFYVSWGTCWGFFPEKTDSFFYRSQTFSNNNLDFWQRTFSRVAKIEFYISKGTFCGISSKKHWITFTVSRLWAKNIRTFCKSFQQA